ncbi:terminase large subunit [soil metagenome]
MTTWSTACLDWKRRIRERRTLIPFTPLFPASAEAKMAVFTSLKITDLGTNPATGDYWTIGESASEWLLDFAAAIFGAYNPETGEQMIRKGMLLVSKKNTKSTIAAGIMLTELICGWRPSDENLILAPTIEVAGNSFKPACAMIRADEELDALLHIQEHIRLITQRVTKATLKVVAADAATVSGKKASRVLIDELWLFGKRPNADAMLREATGGQVSRPEGYTLYLTTQADDEPAGVFKELLTYARDVRDGVIQDPEFLPVLYEFPEEMIEAEEYLDPANFFITNPNLGKSVSQKWLESEFRQVATADDGAKQVFYAKHLNIEIGLRLRSDRWIGADFWKRGADPTITLDSIIARSEVIIVGLDGGGLDDLYGMTIVGREPQEIEVAADEAPEETQEAVGGKKRIKRWLSWSHAYAHRVVLDRRKSIASKLTDLESAGDLTIFDDGAMTDGLPADVAAILKIISRIKDAGLLCCVAVDPAGLGEMVDVLAGADITVENRPMGSNYVIGAPQGYAMMNAIKTAERKLANGTLIHAEQPLMDWCVGNLKIENTATAIRATKQNAGDAKIDPAMALFDAVTAMATNPDALRSVYETRGLLIL